MSGPHPFTTSDPRAYIWLAATLAEQIGSGRHTPGQRTPSIGELCLETGVSRQTAGRALRLLEREGLIYRVPGHGYYVTGTP